MASRTELRGAWFAHYQAVLGAEYVNRVSFASRLDGHKVQILEFFGRDFSTLLTLGVAELVAHAGVEHQPFEVCLRFLRVKNVVRIEELSRLLANLATMRASAAAAGDVLVDLLPAFPGIVAAIGTQKMLLTRPWSEALAELPQLGTVIEARPAGDGVPTIIEV